MHGEGQSRFSSEVRRKLPGVGRQLSQISNHAGGRARQPKLDYSVGLCQVAAENRTGQFDTPGKGKLKNGNLHQATGRFLFI
jgi:hypothetical protein